MSRSGLNEILPGKLYQRGQILTWQREKKYSILQEYGIRTVVNFWPKIDPDMGEAPVDNYLFLAAPRSLQMLERRMEKGADLVANLAQTAPVLVLCEAGVTRSVYFCVLVLSRLEGLTLAAAYDRVRGVIRTDLKPFMLTRIGVASK